MNAVLVTRHAGLVEWLADQGHSFDEVVPHATSETVAGRDVWGVLPMWLAAQTASFTEVSLTVPLGLRGVELTKDQVAQCNPRLVRYAVFCIDDTASFDAAKNSGDTFIYEGEPHDATLGRIKASPAA